MKLCVATATHNFKWVKITHICSFWDKTFANLDFWMSLVLFPVAMIEPTLFESIFPANAISSFKWLKILLVMKNGRLKYWVSQASTNNYLINFSDISIDVKHAWETILGVTGQRLRWYVYVFWCTIYRRFPIEDVPTDNDEECSQWLYKLYAEKVTFYCRRFYWILFENYWYWLTLIKYKLCFYFPSKQLLHFCFCFATFLYITPKCVTLISL